MALNYTEAAYAREQLHRIDMAIAQTDESLDQLREMLDSYTRRREAQVDTRKSCAALLSPFRDFPIELLGHIFMFACEGSLQVRWTVSHVCRRWRLTAIAMPELWNTAHMPRDEGLEGYVETCILRSHSRRMKLECWEDQDFDISDQFDVLSSVLRRAPWTELTWTSYGRGHDTILDVFHQVLSDIVASSSETLKSMIIRTTDPEEYWWGVELPPGLVPLSLEKFLRLRKLHLSTYHPVLRDSLRILWENVTDLSIEAPLANYALIQDILLKCCALEYCMFNIRVFDGDPWDASSGSCILQHLRKLHLNSLQAELFYRILDTLQAPALTDLVVESKFFSQLRPMPLQKFLSYCSSTLRRLWMAPIFGYEIQDIIAPTVPLLEELGVMLHRDHVREPLDALLLYMEKEPLLPQLRALTVVSLPSSEVYSCFMSVVGNRGLCPEPISLSLSSDNFPRLRYMRLYQHDPNWNYQYYDLEAEQEWREVGSDEFEIRVARVEQEFKAAFLTSPEWPIAKDET